MVRRKSFVEKYRPESLSEVAGHEKKKGYVKSKAEEDSPVILYGPAGTGKTSTAEALAKEKGWNISEINASSARTKGDMITLANQIRTQAIDGNKTLFIIDELDSISVRSLKPLVDILDNPPNPVVGTANEMWKVPDSIEDKCTTYKFDLDKDDIKPFLSRVADEEGIDITSRQLGQLATRNGLRDALNDLQQFSDSDANTDWDDRESDDSPFAITERILRNKNYIGGRSMTPPDVVDFLDENLPGEFEGVELMRAYQALSEADQWHQHVNETQNYSWWKYSGPISESVANMRLSEPYDGWMNINYPSIRRQSSPRPNGEMPEVKLYKELKDNDKPNYSASFGYQEFTNIILPILKDLEAEKKYQLILSESLSNEGLSALGVSKSLYNSWLAEEGEMSVDDVGKKSKGSSNMDGKDTEKTSIFDF